MKLPLLRKYLIVSLAFTAFFLVLSFFIIHLYFQLRRRDYVSHFPQFDAWVFNRTGNTVESSTDRPLPFDIHRVALPHGQTNTTLSFGGSDWDRKPPVLIVQIHAINAGESDHAANEAAHETANEYVALIPQKPNPAAHETPSDPQSDHPPSHRHHKPILLFAFVIVSAFLLGSASSAIVLLKKLFDELKLKEQSRTRALQELAHDLRTPIASMQNNLSLLAGEQGPLSESSHVELIATSQKEASYIETLVNDLLLVSQLAGAQTEINRNPVDLVEIIEDELDVLDMRQLNQAAAGGDIKIKIVPPTQPLIVEGNALLLKRLFRNVIHNAFSFARHEIEIKFEIKSHIEVTVFDDGPGFSEQALQDYGERRPTRFVDASQGNRISVGLGSVIVKAIAKLHDAQVIPSNRLNADGTVAGAQIKIIF